MSKNKYSSKGTYSPVPPQPGFQAGAARYNLEKAARGKGLKGAVGGAISAAKLHPGKAALGLGALAAAGGLGVAGIKAMRKPKSLQDRIKKAANKNPMLNQASKMFR